MTDSLPNQALYYPFHLCHETTLHNLLARFAVIHFRDYMAIHLTAMAGLMAYQDRMGDAHPELLAHGRMIQGHSVSGPLDQDITIMVERDLHDPVWRRLFHHAMTSDRRFQRGLFDWSHGMRIGSTLVPGPAAFLALTHEDWISYSFSVDMIRTLSKPTHSLTDAYTYEYGLALVKTAAAGAYTVRLATQLSLQAVTDSPSHYHLLERSRERDGFALTHELCL
jgi:hypothetical protein